MTEHAPRGLARLTAWRYDAELRGLAPHVDAAWAEAFVVELRLRDVPGRAIGAALAEVESHCAESGEPAVQAFGEPVPYAASLELPSAPTMEALSLGGALRWLLQAVGLLVTTSSVTVWQAANPLELTTGLLALVVVLVASIVALTRAADRVLRFVVEHTVAAWALSMVHLGVLVGLLLVFDEVLVAVDPAPALVVGVILLAVGTVAVARDLRADATADDPVVAPLDTDDSELPAGFVRAVARLRYAPALLMPITAVVVVALTVLLG